MKRTATKNRKGYTINQELHANQKNPSWRADVQYKGIHLRQRFKSKGEAESWAQGEVTRLKDEGVGTVQLDRDTKQDAAKARQELGEDGGSLLEAVKALREAREVLGEGEVFGNTLKEVRAAREELAGRVDLVAAARFWVAHNPDMDGKTLGEVADAYQRSLENKGRSPGHLKAVRQQIQRFTDVFGRETPAAQIMEEDVRGFMRKLEKAAPRSRRYWLGTLKRLFQYAVREYKLPSNPAANLIVDDRIEDGEPQFYSAEQVEKLLRACEETAPDFAPALAILFFAGVRPVELSGQYTLREEYTDPTGAVVGGLDWEQVDVGGDIVITAKVAKTSARRRIPISKNLRAWLDAYGGERKGRVVPNPRAWRRIRGRIAAAAGVEWGQDWARHSFASFHLALHQNRDALEAQMGHGKSSTMLETHYKGLATREEAKRFWNIMPATGKRKKKVTA
jgi:integrase